MISQRPTHLKSLLWIGLLALTCNFVVAPPGRPSNNDASDSLLTDASDSLLIDNVAVSFTCSGGCGDNKQCCSSSRPNSDRLALDYQCRPAAACQLRLNGPDSPTPGGPDRVDDDYAVIDDRVRPTPGFMDPNRITVNCAQFCGIYDDGSIDSVCFADCLLANIVAVGNAGDDVGDDTNAVRIDIRIIGGFGAAAVLVGSFSLYNRKRKQEAPAVNEFQADVELDSDVELEMDSVVDAEETY